MRKKLLIRIGIILVVVILAWAGYVIYRSVHLLQTSRTLMAELQAEKSDFAQLKNDFAAITDDLVAIRSSVQPVYPILSVTKGVPGIGPYLGQIEPVLNLGEGLSQAGKLMLDTFEPVINPSGGGTENGTAIERLFKAIQTNQPALDQAARLIDQVAPEREKINPDLIPEAYRGYYDRFDTLFPLLQSGFPIIKQLPALMGAAGRQNYLVLALNRDELRASGGFITGIGLAALEKGKLVDFTLGDSYTVDDYSKDYPPAPAPLEKFMLAPYWVTRDANWSPDFPTAATQTQKLYTLSTGISTRGVIAFNQLAVKRILEVIGPVKIDGYPDPISAASVENFMRQSWAPDPQTGVTPQWWANRKKFMGDLGKIILSKLLSGADSKTGLGLAKVGMELIQSGQLLVYVDQPEIAALLTQAGLSGGLEAGRGDYLYLVDSNLGFNKVDSLITRELSYQVDLSRLQNPTARIIVKYQHTVSENVPCKHEPTYGKGTYADMQTRCYWDFWRIYLPVDNRLTGSSVLPVSGNLLLNKSDWNGPVQQEPGEKDLSVVSGMMVLPTHSQQETKLQIDLSPNFIKKDKDGNWVYSLRIPKQPGLAWLPVSIQIKLPDGAVLSQDTSGWAKGKDQIWTWSGKLTETQDLSFKFRLSAP
jgi:hypothetical protein